MAINDSEDKIDILLIIQSLWKSRSTIIKSAFLFTVLGFFYYLLSPSVYRSKIVFIEQSTNNKSSLGGLSGVASLAGINMSEVSNNMLISKKMYPLIMNSYPFHMKLMNTYVTQGNDSIKLIDYYKENKDNTPVDLFLKYTIKLPHTIKSHFSDEKKTVKLNKRGLMEMSTDELYACNRLNDCLELTFDEENNNSIMITANSSTALMSSEICNSAFNILQDILIKIRINKSVDRFDFLKKRYDELVVEFQNSQRRLAIYKDRNKNITTSLGNSISENMQNEHSIIYNVFSDISKEMEHAKLNIKEDTPSLVVIEPIVIPHYKASPGLLLIITISFFIGSFLSVSIIIIRCMLPFLRSVWND